MRSSARLVVLVSVALLATQGQAQTRPGSSAPLATNSSLTEPLTPVKVNEKWGYQDGSGALVIPPQFDRVKSFSEGLAPVELHKKFGYVDTSGRVVIAMQFASADPFSDGLALVYTTWGMNIFGTEGWDLFRRGGYIDHTGKFVVGPRFTENANRFSEGVAAFQPGAASPGKAKWGYLDKTGEWAIKPSFEIATDFSEGLAAVKVSVGKKAGQKEPTYKWGYIDHSGNFAIQPQFDGAMPFRNNIAVVSVRTQDSPLRRPKCIDRQGSSITECPPARRPETIPGSTALRPKK